MPIGSRILLDDVCYHITTRGNQKQDVFRDRADFLEYLKRIKIYKKKFRFRLYGFCLMPNHVHILGEVENKKDLSKFMHGLTRSYTAYFNNKYQKVGYLWQGRFKSKPILKNKYLINCIHYVELNPVRGNITRDPEEYTWSSYRERNLETKKKEEQLLNKWVHVPEHL